MPTIHPTPIGRLLLQATPRGLCRLRLLDHDSGFDPAELTDVTREDGDIPPDLLEKIDQAIAGRLPAWKLPLDLQGPEFLLRVWKEMVRIPWGQTLSYAELARRAGRPRAIRAAASACARNPIAFLVPCHRVLATGGGLGGYGYGLKVKRMLLRREGVAV